MSEETGIETRLRPLQLNDLPFVTALESSSFPPNEAASLEKVIALFNCGLIVDHISPHYLS